MKTRKHHTRQAPRSIKRGTHERQLFHIARRLGIPYKAVRDDETRDEAHPPVQRS